MFAGMPMNIESWPNKRLEDDLGPEKCCTTSMEIAKITDQKTFKSANQSHTI